MMVVWCGVVWCLLLSFLVALINSGFHHVPREKAVDQLKFAMDGPRPAPDTCMGRGSIELMLFILAALFPLDLACFQRDPSVTCHGQPHQTKYLNVYPKRT